MAGLKWLKLRHRGFKPVSRLYRITALMRYITVASLTICFLFAGNAEALTNHTRKVLVLNSYHRGYYWSDNIMDAVRNQFDESGLDVELFFEYLDAKRYQNEDIFPYLKELYKSKYNTVKFDVVISSDNDALVFLLAYRDFLFPGVPIVFCGVQQFQDSILKDQDSITGVLEVYDYASTIEIALELHPSAKQVVVVTEQKSTVFVYLDDITRVISKFDREVELVAFSLQELSMAELLQKIQELGDESVVLLASAFKDRDGNIYTLESSAAMIKKHSTAPIYTTGFDWLGLGPVGGKLTYGPYQGQQAAKMAIRILKGEKPQNIPILRESPNAYMFDFIQLRHFGIPLSDLPENSIVINEPHSFYYEHKTHIWIVTAIIAGLVIIVVVLALNILRRKKAEAAMRESQEFFYAFLDRLPVVAFIKDQNSRVQYVNPCMIAKFGADEWIDRTASDYYPREIAEGVFAHDRRVLAEGSSAREEWVIDRNGNMRCMHTHKFPIRRHGKQTLIGGMAIDITERKIAEEALRQSEEKYRSVIENISIGVSLISPKMEILTLNKQLRRWFPNIDVSEKPLCYESFHFPSRKSVCPYCPTYKSLKDGRVHESTIETPRGDKIVNYRVVSSPVKDKDGNVIAAIEMVEDITELKRREQELLMYHQKMARAEQLASLGTISATLAHELTQPLTVIRLSIENLLEELKTASCPDPLTEELKDSLEEVVNAASIVDRFRNFARRASGKKSVEINLGKVLEKIVELLNESTKLAKMTVIVKNIHQLPTVWANHQDMEQFFFAMIQNAMQAAAGKKNRRLTISGQRKDEHIELRFSDNCGGIALDNLDKIFEPFFTTGSDSSRTGLGLCIVLRILSECGGKIRVDTKFGKGTTFYVTLPIHSNQVE
ncbi:MAG: PAS domain S-box protein [Planctomycetota bacterium]|nr:MAG: PAS domain S-box protein [Planctomycetota bacterium]